MDNLGLNELLYIGTIVTLVCAAALLQAVSLVPLFSCLAVNLE